MTDLRVNWQNLNKGDSFSQYVWGLDFEFWPHINKMWPFKKINQLFITPRLKFVKMLTLKYRPSGTVLTALLYQNNGVKAWTGAWNLLHFSYYTSINLEMLTPRFREMVILNYFVNWVEVWQSEMYSLCWEHCEGVSFAYISTAQCTVALLALWANRVG